MAVDGFHYDHHHQQQKEEDEDDEQQQHDMVIGIERWKWVRGTNVDHRSVQFNSNSDCRFFVRAYKLPYKIYSSK